MNVGIERGRDLFSVSPPEPQSLFLENGENLGVEPFPLPHAGERQERVPAEPPLPPLGRGPSRSLLKGFPDIKERQEVGVRMAVGSLGPGRILLFSRRPFPRIADAHGGGDHGDLAQAVPARRFEKHARDPGIEGNAGHGPAPVGEDKIARLPADGSEFGERLEAVPNGPGRRPVDEREIRGVPEPEVEHPEDDAREIRAKDFGRREFRPILVILLGIEAEAHPLPDTPAAALALVGARPGDGAYGQAVDPRPRLVLGDPGRSRVDDIADPGNRERGLGDVRGHNDFRSRNRIDPALGGRRKT